MSFVKPIDLNFSSSSVLFLEFNISIKTLTSSVGLTSKTCLPLSGYNNIVAPPIKTTFSFNISNAFATVLILIMFI